MDLSPLKAILIKMEQADAKILEDMLVAALFSEVDSLLPIAIKPYADLVIAEVQPLAQAAFSKLLDKAIPQPQP